MAATEPVSFRILLVEDNAGDARILEGVESAGQMGFLREQRCDRSQGFYFTHPLPAEEITDLLRQGPRWSHA